MNGLFLALPLVLTAVLLPVAVLGLAGARGAGAAHAWWTVVACLVLFAVVGKPDNWYWGAVYTPLLALGLGWLPLAVRDLRRSLRPAGLSESEPTTHDR